jgi:hydroxyacylglutathione hydrolase
MNQHYIQLTPELWLTQSRAFKMNSGLVISDGQACLIDPGVYPDEIDGLAQFLAERNAAPALIVLTHNHLDHILGPGRFPGVPVAAHPAYQNEAALQDAARRVWKWEAEEGLSRAAPFQPPQPDRWLNDGEVLKVGRVELRFIHVPGHAPDQMAVYLPERAALWAADILSDVEIPFVSDSLADYERTLARLAELEIEVLAPGHGAATCDRDQARARLEHDRAYLAALHRNVGHAVAEGLSVEATVAACTEMDYHHRADNEPSHRLNVEQVYVELGGKADAAKVGWSQEE